MSGHQRYSTKKTGNEISFPTYQSCSLCEKKQENTKFDSCSGCRNAIYCSVVCQKQDWKKHKLDCERLKNIREEAQLSGMSKQSNTLSFDDGENSRISMASGTGSFLITRSSQPNRMPHIISMKKNCENGSDQKSEIVVRFKMVSELDPALQFLIYCGELNDVAKCIEILPLVLGGLPRQSPWNDGQWNNIGDVKLYGAGFRALEWAARKGHFEIAEWLCTEPQTRPCITAGCPVGWSCYADNVELTKMMVKHGADLTAVDKVSYNRPPLLLAVGNGSLFVCKMLVDHFKQDINVISFEGQGILETIEQDRKFMATRNEQIKPGVQACEDWAIERGCKAVGPCERAVYNLKLRPLTKEIASEWLVEVVHLTNDSPNRDKFGKAACDAVIAATSLYPQEIPVIYPGLMAINNLSVNHIANVKRLGKSGACELVCNALLTHSRNAEIADIGCMAVTTLSFIGDDGNDGNNRRFFKAKAVTAVLAALSANEANPAIVLRSSIALRNLTITDVNLLRLGECGCEILSDVLRAHQSNHEIAKEVLIMIFELAVTSDIGPSNIKKFGRSLVCEMILDTLNIHIKNAEVVSRALSAIGALGGDGEVFSIRGCSMLLAIIRAHPLNSDIAAGIVGAISNISCNEAKRKFLAKDGACHDVLTAMRNHLHVVRVAENGLGAIRNLAGDDFYRARLGELGACVMVMKALKKHSTIPTLVKGCAAVKHLLYNNASNKSLLKSLDIWTLMENISRNPLLTQRTENNEMVQRAVADIECIRVLLI